MCSTGIWSKHETASIWYTHANIGVHLIYAYINRIQIDWYIVIVEI